MGVLLVVSGFVTGVLIGFMAEMGVLMALEALFSVRNELTLVPALVVPAGMGWIAARFVPRLGARVYGPKPSFVVQAAFLFTLCLLFWILALGMLVVKDPHTNGVPISAAHWKGALAFYLWTLGPAVALLLVFFLMRKSGGPHQPVETILPPQDAEDGATRDGDVEWGGSEKASDIAPATGRLDARRSL